MLTFSTRQNTPDTPESSYIDPAQTREGEERRGVRGEREREIEKRERERKRERDREEESQIEEPEDTETQARGKQPDDRPERTMPD